jgi:hypothetical protein
LGPPPEPLPVAPHAVQPPPPSAPMLDSDVLDDLGLATGERNGSARLTEDQVREARRLRRSGATFAELGRRFGVSTNAAMYAVTGKTWAHLDALEPPGR